MALQIRRGTDAERLTITPAEGELIYTTDTKLLYVGDGTTVGGTKADTGINDLAEDTTPQLGGTLDLNSNNITGVGNISNSGNITATGVVSAASGNFTSATIGLATGNFKGTFAADDSTVLIDGVSGKVNLAPNVISDIGNVHNSVPTDGDALVWNGTQSRWEAGAPANAGDVVGSVYSDDSTLKIDGISGISYGPFVGDLTGSVFADDSSLLVDATNGQITTSQINTAGGAISIESASTGRTTTNIRGNEERGVVNLIHTSNSDISSDDSVYYGSMYFGRDDTGGTAITSLISGRRRGLYFATNTSSSFSDPLDYMVFKDGNLGIGLEDATEKLHVVGSAVITSDITAAAVNANIKADDSTVIIDAATQSGSFTTVSASTSFQLPTFADATARDAAITSPQNGMMCYITNLHDLQVYKNSAWVSVQTA